MLNSELFKVSIILGIVRFGIVPNNGRFKLSKEDSELYKRFNNNNSRYKTLVEKVDSIKNNYYIIESDVINSLIRNTIEPQLEKFKKVIENSRVKLLDDIIKDIDSLTTDICISTEEYLKVKLLKEFLLSPDDDARFVPLSNSLSFTKEALYEYLVLFNPETLNELDKFFALEYYNLAFTIELVTKLLDNTKS